MALNLGLVAVMEWDFEIFPREGTVLYVWGEGSKELFRPEGWTVAEIPVMGSWEI